MEKVRSSRSTVSPLCVLLEKGHHLLHGGDRSRRPQPTAELLQRAQEEPRSLSLREWLSALDAQ